MSIRTNTAVWVESRQRWQINVQKDGCGQNLHQREARPYRPARDLRIRKADEWLEHSVVSTSTKVDGALPSVFGVQAGHHQSSNCRPMEGRWRNKIQPLIGQKSIGRLTDGDLQQVLDRALAGGYSRKSLQNLRADLCAFLKWARRNRYTTLTGEDLEISKAAQRGQKRILQPKDVLILFNVDTTTIRKNKAVEDYINAYRLEVLKACAPGRSTGWNGPTGTATGWSCAGPSTATAKPPPGRTIMPAGWFTSHPWPARCWKINIASPDRRGLCSASATSSTTTAAGSDIVRSMGYRISRLMKSGTRL